MKKLIPVILAILVVLSGCGTGGGGGGGGLVPKTTGDTPPGTEANASASGETTQAAQLVRKNPTEFSDDLYDYQFKFDGIIYQLPMYYSDFIDLGWKITDKDDENTLVPSDSHVYIYHNFWQLSCSVDIVNFTYNEAKLSDCVVFGIDFDEYSLGNTDYVVELTKGIKTGVSTLADIEAAYGTPSDIYEGNTYTQYTYSEDSYKKIILYVYNDSGVLESVEMQNAETPAGFDAGKLSNEVPDCVASYIAPTELGTNLLSYTFVLDGKLYKLPCPVMAFINNGYTVVEDDSDEYISADSYADITLRKNNSNVELSVDNPTTNSVKIEHGMVYDVQIRSTQNQSNYSFTDDNATLPLNIKMGMSKSDVIDILNDNSITFEEDNSYSYVHDIDIYYNTSSKYNDYVSLSFNTDSDTLTSFRVTCSK